MEWSSERIENLRSLWRDGLPASQIATQLGGITRNAVIGKAHRLGLTGRPSPIKNQPAALTRPRAPRPPRVEHPPRASAPPVAAVLEVSPPPQPAVLVSPKLPAELSPMPGASILTLTDRTCKWPIGDPRDRDFHFCGRVSTQGLPYCAEHARRAYQPPARRSGERDDAVQHVAAHR